jgi:predicted 3-demethylubiquinone-9 3-methyltransferase (glyoxalase superfamily)
LIDRIDASTAAPRNRGRLVAAAAEFGGPVDLNVVNATLVGRTSSHPDASPATATPQRTHPDGEVNMAKPAKNTIGLWYDGDAEEAARFYAKTFPDSSVAAVHRAPGDFPGGKKGQVLTVEFTVLGIPCLGLNGGPTFKQSEAFSFQVATADQAETDRYWNAIVGNGGQESACGWCKDKWGLSWQITPIALTKAVTDPDSAAAKRSFDAMMKMKKIDIAAIEAARRG